MDHEFLDQLMLSLKIKKSKYDKVLLEQLKQLADQYIKKYQFTDVNIIIDIEGTNFIDCHFPNTYLNAIDFYSCKFVNCHFEKCSFRKTALVNTEFVQCTIIDSDLTRMEFLEGNIKQSNFINCSFDYSDISRSIISDVSFSGFFLEESSDLFLNKNKETNVTINIEAVNLDSWTLRNYM